jgi:hypothetical protein
MASEQDDPCPCGHASATEHNLDALRKNRQLVERMTARIAALEAENRRLRGALAGTESALFEIRDYCAELHDGDTLERLAYRVVGMANGAINDYYAALAGGEDER